MAGVPDPASRGPAVLDAAAKGHEQALTLAAMGFYEEALKALRDITARAPDHAPAWCALAQLLRLADRDEEADAAEARATGGHVVWPPAKEQRGPAELAAAESALRARMAELAVTDKQGKTLRDHLRKAETDVIAMRLLGRLEFGQENYPVARALFERALSLAPESDGLRADYAHLLRKLREPGRAVIETRRLVERDPTNASYRALHADLLGTVGDVEQSLPIIEQLLREQPSQLRFRLVYAQALHYAGRHEEAAREFRACLAMQPGLGEAYWGLAELRGDYLTSQDIDDIRAHLAEGKQAKPGQMLLHHALGYALEKARRFGESFAAYDAGATLAREIAAAKGEAFDAFEHAGKVQQYQAAYSANVLAKGAAPEPRVTTPIFVVGMPRAGSTLVEQILASHSQVEATIELPIMAAITRDLALSRRIKTPNAFPEYVRDFSAAQLARLGERYLAEAKAYRKTDRPYFVDKWPGNWMEVGLIHLMLPQAKIIDVRREPMAACFAMFKQMLANVSVSNDFGDLAQFYTQYTRMMEYWQGVLPGRVHFLKYERLVEDTETEVRRLFDYCGLPFEEGSLRFWETKRAVSTASAGQVRRPIYRDAKEQWRNFEPWLGPLKDALSAAEADAAAEPHPIDYERGAAFAAMGLYEPAMEELDAVARRLNTHPASWEKLAELLTLAGEDEEAAKANEEAAQCASERPKWRTNYDPRTVLQLEAEERVLQARTAASGRVRQMEAIREHLDHNPTDAAATRLLARLEDENGDQLTALNLLYRTLELSPSHLAARADLAAALLRDAQFPRAVEHTTALMEIEPGNLHFRALHSDALKCLDRYDDALALAEEWRREEPDHPRFWLGYGQLLRSVGRRDESVAAFRTALKHAPAMGEAYWGLADLKSGLFSDADVAAMRARLADHTLDPTSRMNLYYALGRALEEKRDFAGSFKSYESGARLFRGNFLARGEAYSENEFVGRLRALKRVYNKEMLDRPVAAPSTAATPIFIVGMPRAGSTLLEQIVASHSLVEGTRELPLIGDIVRTLDTSRRIANPNAYPECVRNLSSAQLSDLGARYLEGAAAYRKTDRPFFIDKRPWNWIDIGLIHLILPQARIIDIRREPMAACFAMFKQVLTDGADFTYDLRDLGGYYREYAGMMEYWRGVLPGRIHFLRYEELVEDTENQIRRLLDYCGLPFEENCLRFWETKRAVTTPSAEQVRRPIYRDALEQWRDFEPWLGPLKTALTAPPRA